MAELTYSYRPHALSPERLFRLQHDGLAWSMANRKGSVAYRDIEQVQIFKARFLGSSTTYWNVVLFSRTGGRIKLAAASRVGFKAVEDRTSVYLPFIHELQARLRQANPGAARRNRPPLAAAPRGRRRMAGGRAVQSAAARQPAAEQQCRGLADAPDRPRPAARPPDREGAARHRLSRKVRSRDRAHPVRHVGQSRTGQRRVRASRPHLGFRSRQPAPAGRIVVDDATIERCSGCASGAARC